MPVATSEPVAAIRFDPDARGDTSASSTTHEWYRDPTGHFRTGFWSAAPGCIAISAEKDELCVILEGVVRLTDAAGRAEIYRRGDTFLIPNGFKGVWETVEPVRKFYAVHRPEA
jgi:uncharacterized cupin superfamily protein